MGQRRTAAAVGLVLLGSGLLAGGGAVGYLTSPASTATPPPSRVPAATAIERSRSSLTAPAAFRSRRELRSCGDVVLQQGEEVPEQAIACLARGGRAGRELAVAAPTTEGDLIVTFFRTGSGIDGTDVFADTSRDRFGPRGWSRTRCPTRSIGVHGVCA